MNRNACILAGALLGVLAVVLGAFGAHGLESYLVEHNQAANYETAARYQMYHALALVLLGVLAERHSGRALRIAGWCFLSGVVIFSGALYAIALTHVSQLGMVAPIGGTLLIAGWVAMAIGGIAKQSRVGIG